MKRIIILIGLLFCVCILGYVAYDLSLQIKPTPKINPEKLPYKLTDSYCSYKNIKVNRGQITRIDSCNICSCSKSGSFICTMKKCTDEDQVIYAGWDFYIESGMAFLYPKNWKITKKELEGLSLGNDPKQKTFLIQVSNKTGFAVDFIIPDIPGGINRKECSYDLAKKDYVELQHDDNFTIRRSYDNNIGKWILCEQRYGEFTNVIGNKRIEYTVPTNEYNNINTLNIMDKIVFSLGYTETPGIEFIQ